MNDLTDKKVLVTGVAGFIFSNFIRKVTQQYPNTKWIGVDKLVKHYNIDNLYEHPNYKFYTADIADEHIMDRIFDIERPDFVIGGAAESFVDNSITDIRPFIHTNIVGTQTLVNCCLKYETKEYLHISTDEVYGQKTTRDDRPWMETDPLLPRNPYATTKAAAELIVQTAHYTHNLPYKMTRSCNVFGPRQKRENLVPHIIHSLANNVPIRIHGDGLNWRQYIRVNDKISGIIKILEAGKINNTYNIGDNNYFTNLEMVDQIAHIMKKKPAITFIEDRKCHDFGYSVNCDKLRELGWFPKYTFTNNMQDTIRWYMENK